MKRLLAIITFSLLLIYGCVKESYDLENLSKKAEVSPVLVIPVLKGSVFPSDTTSGSGASGAVFELADTTRNYFQVDESYRDAGIEDIDVYEIGVYVKNGFPFDIEAKVSLFDSASGTVRSTINFPGVIMGAPTNADGKVSGMSESFKTIEVTEQFRDNIDLSDRLIFSFTMATSGSGNTKIFSDYRLDFKITAHLKTKIQINL